MWRAVAVPILLSSGLLWPGSALAGAESLYTSIDLEACPEGQDFGDAPAFEVVCPGPEGWEMRVVEGDLRFHVEPRPAGAETELRFQTLPAFNTIHTTAEWRGHRRGDAFEPYAFILRYFTDGGMGDGSDRGNVLVVSKVDRSRSCHAAYVDARLHANANEIALRVADTLVRDFDCALDEPVTVNPDHPVLP